jgi:C4-dicarboxylate transporter, DctQ subunit
MVNKVIKVLHHAEEIALAYVSLGLGILIVLEILLRSTGVTAFYWLEELGRYVLIFMTLCGASIAVRSDSHPKMTAIFSFVPEKGAHIIKAIVNIFLALFFAYIDYIAWAHILHVKMIGMQTSTLGIPFYVPYVPIGVFLFIICVRYLIDFVKEIQAFRDFVPTDANSIEGGE